MHKNATKCNKTQSKWCINKHGVSKIIDTFKTYQEEGSLEARMEELEQEVFRYKKMAEREVDIIHRINQELIAKHKKETAELWDDILSLHETTNKLQAQLYDLQNQNYEYEARFKQMSFAASFRILETKSSFLDGEPLPWKSDDDKDAPPPKE
jgi:hypothetical protein